jgi:hypothetical protein
VGKPARRGQNFHALQFPNSQALDNPLRIENCAECTNRPTLNEAMFVLLLDINAICKLAYSARKEKGETEIERKVKNSTEK